MHTSINHHFHNTCVVPILTAELKQKYRWLGDNIGLADAVVVRTLTSAGLIDLELKEALHRIDDFDVIGQRRILTCLPFHFNMEMV